VILIFFGNKAYSFNTKANGLRKEFPKMITTIIFWLVLSLVSTLLITNHLAANNSKFDCKKYDCTNESSGGIKELQNQKYSIKICGSGINHGGILADDAPDLAELEDHIIAMPPSFVDRLKAKYLF
jgi:hypothetical protein